MGETFSVQEILECRTIHNSKSETFWWNCKKWKKAAYMNQHLHTLSWPILLLQKDFSLYITDWCRWWNTYSLVILQCDIFLPLIMSGKKKSWSEKNPKTSHRTVLNPTYFLRSKLLQIKSFNRKYNKGRKIPFLRWKINYLQNKWKHVN